MGARTRGKGAVDASKGSRRRLMGRRTRERAGRGRHGCAGRRQFRDLGGESPLGEGIRDGGSERCVKKRTRGSSGVAIDMGFMPRVAAGDFLFLKI